MDASPSSASQPKKKRRFFGWTDTVFRSVSAQENEHYLQSSQSPRKWNIEDLGVVEENEALSTAQTLLTFYNDPSAFQLIFDGANLPVLDAKQRVEVHAIAEKMNLEHESVGEGEFRFMTVSKKVGIVRGPELVLVEFYFADTYFGLKGAMVDAVASKYERWLHESVLEKRRSRDGPHHHITILSAASIAKLCENMEPSVLFSKMVSAVMDSWKDVGLGRVSDESGSAPPSTQTSPTPTESALTPTSSPESALTPTLSPLPSAFFVLVDWPSASQFLSSIGAEPQHFHITLGFQHNDVHNVPKTVETKVKEEDLPSLSLLHAFAPPSKDKKKAGKTTNTKPGEAKDQRDKRLAEGTNGNANASAGASEPSSLEPSSSKSSSSSSSLKKPKMPLSSYLIFVGAKREEVKAANPSFSFGELAKEVSLQWTTASPETKAHYTALSDQDKARYQAELALYQEELDRSKS